MRRIAERLAFVLALLLIAVVAGSTAARVGPDLGIAGAVEVREDVRDVEGEVASLVRAHWEAEGSEAAWSVRDLKVELYGSVAVATFLAESRAAQPDGRDIQTPRQVTEVWVRQDGEWRETHHHDSRLEFP